MAPIPVTPELEKAFVELATSATGVSSRMINHLADTDMDPLQRLAEAQTAGHRTMLAIDMATPDPQVRIIAVGPDNLVIQIAALGVISPSDRAN